MTTAIFYGASSGALHAVSGPDHVLSLGPVALAHPRHSWRIGLSWGLGHALGTVCLAFPLWLVSGMFSLSVAAGWGNRLAGVALLGMAAWSWRSARPAAPASAGMGASKPFAVGLVHGVTGAGSLLIMLPVLIRSDVASAVLFLVAFSFGSAAAMAALTWAIARLGARLNGPMQARARRWLLAAGAGLGAFWVLGG